MVQAVESEKKNGTGQGKLFGIFHISAFDVADAPGQVVQAAQDAKNAVGNASGEPPALYGPSLFGMHVGLPSVLLRSACSACEVSNVECHDALASPHFCGARCGVWKFISLKC